ncbi:putative GTP cyclohydrolase-2 [Podosphaera aphanis]|nr:putative GTP cyclohydrolase-2 [Podosphaera aphanis]
MLNTTSSSPTSINSPLPDAANRSETLTWPPFDASTTSTTLTTPTDVRRRSLEAIDGGDDASTHSPTNDERLPDLVSPRITPPSSPTVSSSGNAAPPTPRAKRPKLVSTLPDVSCVVRARIPTTIGGSGTEMFLYLYHNTEDTKEHLAIVFGSTIRSRSLDRARPGETEMDRLIRGAYVGRLYPGRTHSSLPGCDAPSPPATPPLVRIHSECYTGETVWSARCDCGEQLDEAARLMSTPTPATPAPAGIIVYLRQEGRGIGLHEKLKAYNLQDLGSDTVEANILLRHPADARSYGLATAILRDLGVAEIRLLTNNPDKIRAVEGPNREIVVRERVPMVPLAWRPGEERGIRSEEVGGYLKTKIEKMGHLLSMSDDA